MLHSNPDRALELTCKYGAYFLLPGTIAFLIFFFIKTIAHICAFAKGLTPYPKWCWIFCLAVGMVATMLLKLCGNHALTNALTAAWISIGNIWMFLGLLITMKKASVKEKGVKNYEE
jgi:small-conductance mechanosensitive channel